MEFVYFLTHDILWELRCGKIMVSSNTHTSRTGLRRIKVIWFRGVTGPMDQSSIGLANGLAHYWLPGCGPIFLGLHFIDLRPRMHMSCINSFRLEITQFRRVKTILLCLSKKKKKGLSSVED